MSRKVLYALAGAVLVGVGLVVVLVWHPWEARETKSSSVTPHVAEGSGRRVGMTSSASSDEPVSDEAPTTVDAWEGIDENTDVAKLDHDAGYLPMDVSLEQVTREDGVDGMGTLDERDGIVEVDGVEKFVIRRHRWCELYEANASVGLADGSYKVIISGRAFNPRMDETDATWMPPVFVDGRGASVSLDDGVLGSDETGSFSYVAEVPADTQGFDIVVYGHRAHVDGNAEPYDITNASYESFESPALDQAFADEMAVRIGRAMASMRAMDAYFSSFEGK